MTDNAAAPAAPVTPAAPNASAPAAPAATPASTPWYGGFAPDLRGFVESKGFPGDEKGLSALADSYRNLEKHFGAPADKLLRLPDEADKDGWNKVYERLGRPGKPEEYELPVPGGMDSEYAKFISATMHELGITKKQAQALATKQNEFIQSQEAAAGEQYKYDLAKQDVALRSEWGDAHDKNVQIARGAFAELGMDASVIDKLEEAIGFAGVMKMFHSIGAKIGEDKFVSAAGAAGFGGAMSPAAAQARLEAIKADPVLSAKYIKGDAALRQEMDKLHNILARAAG